MMIKQREGANLSKRSRHVVATATALTFLCQNFAWAACADGSTFPTNGFVFGQPPAAVWSQNLFVVRPAGAIFVPDNSVFEHNDPTQPLTGGGHNWVFNNEDLPLTTPITTSTTLCKMIDIGPAGGTPTAWALPSPAEAACIFLPAITGSSGNPPVPIIKGFTDVPYQGDAVTPTCDVTQYVGNNPFVGPALPTNTYFNHLGCSISHGAATTPQTATTYLFVAGISGGLFVVPLTNAASPVAGGPAGKMPGSPDWFGQIPLGQKLTNATVSPDGQFALAMALEASTTVFGCYNPLGDPTRTNSLTGAQSFPITGPIDPNFFVSPANTVPCMQVGSQGLAQFPNTGAPGDLTITFGPDKQPYFGGEPSVTSFAVNGNGDPGGSAATAWPQCLFNGFSFANPAPTTLMGKLAAVFNARSANHCGTAQFNPAFGQAQITLPEAMIRHGQYMYAPAGGGSALVQLKVTVDPVSGLSQYNFRTYATGLTFISGLGVADDLHSLMVYGTPNFPTQEFVTKLPLCEDM
jgi:hypothetical protein